MSNQAKVGIVVLLAIIALGFVVTWKSSLFLKASGYELIGSFENVEGLTVGSEIRYRGFKVGKVLRIDPGTEDIKVYSIINKGIEFPRDSYLRVAFDGLVGLKFLEIRPGKSTDIYFSSQILNGKTTSGIVDFVDIGAQNLIETKAILVAIKNLVERKDIQNAFVNAVLNVEDATVEIKKLTQMLQLMAQSINNIVADQGFQDNFKGTVAGTSKTLNSANDFFEGFGKINVRPSGDILMGGLVNQVKGNLDLRTSDLTSVKMAMGEGPSRSLALLDLQLANTLSPQTTFRIGMINTHLGGGIDYKLNNKNTISADLYDINNPKPNYPRVRFTNEYKYTDYVNLLFQADDFMNGANANYSIGVRVKGLGDN